MQGRHRSLDFRQAEARGDVLRAVPIESLDRDDGEALGSGPIRGDAEALGQIRHIAGFEDPQAPQDLEAAAVRVIHENHGDPVVGREIALRDVLAVPHELAPAERPVVDLPDEAHRAAPMLHVGPARLRDAGEVELSRAPMKPASRSLRRSPETSSSDAAAAAA